jgi:hypothetical protein
MYNFFNLLIGRDYGELVQEFLVTDQFQIQEGHSFFMRTFLFCFCFVTAEVKYFAVQIKLFKLSLINKNFCCLKGVLWSGCFFMRDLGFKMDVECPGMHQMRQS